MITSSSESFTPDSPEILNFKQQIDSLHNVELPIFEMIEEMRNDRYQVALSKLQKRCENPVDQADQAMCTRLKSFEHGSHFLSNLLPLLVDKEDREDCEVEFI